MKIAYIGINHGNSLLRRRALERLGHQVTPIDYSACFRHIPERLCAIWQFHTGAFGGAFLLDKPLMRAVVAAEPELIFVDQGEYLGPSTLRKWRTLNVPIVNYTPDNPFSGRDGFRFRSYLKALPYYDLVAYVRQESLADAKRYGCRNVMRVWHSADEVAHSPHVLSSETQQKFSSEVCFVGTWMPERGAFMASLVRRGVPLSIWGDNWHKAPEWSFLKPHWRGPGLYNPEEYAAALQCAKICIGLVSKGNRDLHTDRSIEIPSLGSVLCAERTSEHLALYEDRKEAFFWSNAEECSEICHKLLMDNDLREKTSELGKVRAKINNYYNEVILNSIIGKIIV